MTAESNAQSADLARLRRWEDAGGSWRIVARHSDGVIVSLCRCDGGEEADRFVTDAIDLRAYVAGRDSSEESFH